MAATDKYQIKDEDLNEGYKVDCYNSPIMDNLFHNKFKQPQEAKKDVEIWYIDLGDLLVEKG